MEHMVQIEDQPDVTYNEIGGCKEQIERLKETIETPLLQPEKLAKLSIEPSKGAVLFGPPGSGKSLCARAVANRSGACFIRVTGSQLVQTSEDQATRIVREIFEMASSKKTCIVYFDAMDEFRAARVDEGTGGDKRARRIMLELINQLDNINPKSKIKVLMATNKVEALDSALTRQGRLDRRVEFSLPDLEARAHIFKIYANFMSCEPGIRFEMLARLFSNSTGEKVTSVCVAAGLFAKGSGRKNATEKDFRNAIDKVISAI